MILSKDSDKYAFMCGSNFYESDITCCFQSLSKEKWLNHQIFFVKIVTEKSDMKYHPYSAAAFKLRRDVTDKTFKKIMQLWTVLHIRGFQIDDCVFLSSLNFVNLKWQLVL